MFHLYFAGTFDSELRWRCALSFNGVDSKAQQTVGRSYAAPTMALREWANSNQALEGRDRGQAL